MNAGNPQHDRVTALTLEVMRMALLYADDLPQLCQRVLACVSETWGARSAVLARCEGAVGLQHRHALLGLQPADDRAAGPDARLEPLFAHLHAKERACLWHATQLDALAPLAERALAIPLRVGDRPQGGLIVLDPDPARVSDLPRLDDFGRTLALCVRHSLILDDRERLACDAVSEARDREAQYRMLFEQMLDGFALHEVVRDADGRPVDYRFLTVNPAFEAMLGIPAGRLLGRTVLEVLPQTERYWIDTYGRVTDSGDSIRCENWSGELGKWFSVHAFMPAANQFATIVQDITLRRQASDSLKASEQRLRTVYQAANTVAFITTDLAGSQTRVREFSPGAERIFGYRRHEILDRPVSLLHPPENRTRFIDNRALFVGEDEASSCETTLLRKNGEAFPALLTIHPVHGPGGEAVGTVSVTLDLTELKRAEHELRAQRDFTAAILDTVDALVVVLDADGRVVRFNRACERLSGHTAAEVLGSQLWELLIPADQVDAVRAVFTDPQVARAAGKHEHHWLTRSGERRLIAWSIVAIVGPTDHGAYVLGTGVDITEQRAAQVALRESEEHFRQLVETTPYGVEEVDCDGVITYANPAHHRILGVSPGELIGRHLWQLDFEDPTAVRDYFHALLAQTPEPQTRALSAMRPDGSQVHLLMDHDYRRDEDGRLLGLIGVLTDVTERVRLEDQLRQAQKMEALGSLAGGIAHDFNNILQGMLGYTQLAQRRIDALHVAQPHLREVIKGGRRAAKMVQHILAFSRQQERDPRAIVLGPIVAEAEQLLHASLPTTIRIEARVRPNSPPIIADPTEIHQVLMNLATNAYHAMSETGGLLTIALDWGPAERLAPTSDVANPALVVVLEVSDSGCGMPQRVRERVFDPYFTTKEVGKGTGMGLAVVHGIVAHCGGHITVESEEGLGSVFRIVFPAAETTDEANEADDGESSDTRPAQATPGIGRGHHILLVDDRQSVVEMTRLALEDSGFVVETAPEGIGALALFRSDPARWDAVVTDQTMPGLTGSELCREVLKHRPDIPVVLCTGYSEGMDEHSARRAGAAAFLEKPISISRLRRTLADLLAE
ncbi:MAG: PAS domain-containing hybrid sensor histidine kinase/response regulator [Planctomycetota bacterium]